MEPIQILALVFVICAPIAWLASEFQQRRGLRIALGSVAIAACFGVAFLVGSLDRMNSNAWFGFASKSLIDATIAELEAGNHEGVLSALKQMQASYGPSYENRARYDILVEETVQKMKSVSPPAKAADSESR